MHRKGNLRWVRSRYVDESGLVLNMYSVEGHNSVSKLHRMVGGSERMMSKSRRQRITKNREQKKAHHKPLLWCGAILSVLLLIASGRSPLSTVRLTLVMLTVLGISSVCLLPTTAADPTSKASVGSIAWSSVVSLLGSTRLLALTSCLTFGSPELVLRARNVLGRVVGIELLIDGLWDSGNFCLKLLLNLVEIEAIFPID